MTAPELFIGIPCYKVTRRFRRTVQFFQARTRLPYVFHTHVEEQSVVRNKNRLLEVARESGASYVCFADDDVEPPHNWDRVLVDGMKAAQAQLGMPIGQTGPRFIYADGSHCNHWANWRADAIAEWSPPVMESARTSCCLVAGLAGTLSIFSRGFLDSIYWTFDDRYERSQVEDLDQSLMCREKGFALLYNGTVDVIHHCLAMTPRAPVENMQKLVDKWRHHHKLVMSAPLFVNLGISEGRANYSSWPLRTRVIYSLLHTAQSIARRAKASVRYRGPRVLAALGLFKSAKGSTGIR